MKIYFTLKNNRIDSFSDLPMDLAIGEDQYEIDTDIEFSRLAKCDYIDGSLVYNPQYEREDEARKIRIRRERECFRIINRGSLWYDTLTNQQKDELKVWYKAWLDAPSTLVIPTLPTWLENV